MSPLVNLVNLAKFALKMGMRIAPDAEEHLDICNMTSVPSEIKPTWYRLSAHRVAQTVSLKIWSHYEDRGRFRSRRL
jgi:hypothetical protein